MVHGEQHEWVLPYAWFNFVYYYISHDTSVGNAGAAAAAAAGLERDERNGVDEMIIKIYLYINYYYYSFLFPFRRPASDRTYIYRH